MKKISQKCALLFFTVVILVALCGPICGDEYERDEKITAYTNEIISSFGNSSNEIQAKLGKPAKSTSEKIENPHDPSVTDTLLTFQYEHIDFGIFVSGSPGGGSKVISMNCASKKFKLKNLNVGDKLESIRKQLGNPSEKKNGLIQYDSDFALLEVHHDANNIVTKIKGYIFLD